MKEVSIGKYYTPTYKQYMFHTCPADIVLYGGAAGGGKSMALLWEAFFECLETPGNRALLLRRTFPELNRSLIQRSLQFFPRDLARYVASEKAWYFYNGSVLEFGFCEREADVYQYQSAEYGYIGFDELTHFTKQQWDYLVNSRLRLVVPGAWPRARAATNPGGVGHQWVYEMFIKDRVPNIVYTTPSGRTVAFIPAKIDDNPYILKYDPEYVIRLNELDPKWRKALKDGDWTVFEGRFFDLWDESIHVVDHFDPPPHWPRFHAMDWGYAKPYSIGWYAISPEGVMYRYRELYGWGGEPNKGSRETADQVAKKVRAIELEAKEYNLIGPADTECWTSEGQTGPTIAETFLDNGVIFVKADKDRVNGWAQCRIRLQTDSNGKPRFIVSNQCKHFIRTIPFLVHSETKPEDIDTDGEDHAADEWRYACMYWRGDAKSVSIPEFHRDVDTYIKRNFWVCNFHSEYVYVEKDKEEKAWWES